MVTMDYLAQKAFDIYYNGGSFTNKEIIDYYSLTSTPTQPSTPEIEAIELMIDRQQSPTKPSDSLTDTPPTLSFQQIDQQIEENTPMNITNDYTNDYNVSSIQQYGYSAKPCHRVEVVWEGESHIYTLLPTLCHHQILVNTPIYRHLQPFTRDYCILRQITREY